MIDTREAIRRALQYAIADRLHFIDCLNGYDPEVANKTKEEIAAMKKILRRRYGSDKTASEIITDSCEQVFVKEIGSP